MVSQADFANVLAKADENMENLPRRAGVNPGGAPATIPEVVEVLHSTREEPIAVEVEDRGSRLREALMVLIHAAQTDAPRFRELFQSAQSAYIITTNHGIICDANPAAAQLLGMISDQLIGQSLLAFVAAPEKERFRARLAPPLGGAVIDDLHFQMRRPPKGTWNVQGALAALDSSLHWLLREVAEPRNAFAELRARELRHRTIVELAPAIILTINAQGRIISWNGEAERFYGWSEAEAIGRDYLELCIPQEHRSTIREELQRCLRGETSLSIESRAYARDGTVRTLFCRCTALPSANEDAAEVVICGQDITDQREGEHNRLLVSEIEHRVKNSLATVLAIADHTMATTATMDEFQSAFTGRIAALARMHTLLTQSTSKSVSLRRLIEQALTPYLGDSAPSISIQGAGILLMAKAAQCFCIALHELATNAAKYGALSRLGGRVEVRWAIRTLSGGERRLHLTWIESDGPPVTPPARQGMGTQITRQCIVYELHGEVDLRFAPEGVQCDIAVPWSKEIGMLDHSEPSVTTPLATVETALPPAERDLLAGRKVLVVEDTHLVATEIARMLRSIGCSCVGPAATVDDALTFIANESFDTALLDVNLDGVHTWSIADELLFREIPFIFITGYACPGSLPPEFRHCHWLEKPFDQKMLAKKLAAVVHQPINQ